MRKITLPLLLCLLLFGCKNNDYTPKPYAYLRIDLPGHNYWIVDTLRHPDPPYWVHTAEGDSMLVLAHEKPYVTFPIIFEANTCIELAEKDSPAGEQWLDIRYPQWDGVVFLTYRRLRSPDSLRSQIDESLRYLEQHYEFASGLEEQSYEDTENHVYGTVYYIKGSRVASTCQFWLTDSTHNFLRGALYLNRAPNNDSLAPVINYMQADIEHLVETLRWRDGYSVKKN